jgi:hypothetical protein
MRPAIAPMKPEWEDLEVFGNYVEVCGKECEANKTTAYTIHIYVAQKPLN